MAEPISPKPAAGEYARRSKRQRWPKIAMTVEEWWGKSPERIIPLGITRLTDPERGPRRSGATPRAVSLPSRRPSSRTGSDARRQLGATVFPALSLNTCAHRLWSGIPIRFPNIKIVLAEGGFGWVPMLMDRLEYMMDQSSENHLNWLTRDITPTEVRQRNFWFCTIDDPSSLASRQHLGVENILFEVDYPHSDSNWPNTQDHISRRYAAIPDNEFRMITQENSAKLYRHPLPRLLALTVSRRRLRIGRSRRARPERLGSSTINR